MFETIVLLMGALPFVVGLYALRKIKDSDDEGTDDQPPPPDPEPPAPVLPPSPRSRRIEESFRAEDRRPMKSQRDRVRRQTRTPVHSVVSPRTQRRAADRRVRSSAAVRRRVVP